MGWTAYDKDGNFYQEGVDGRPVQMGEEGNLLVIIQEDYGHKIVTDLKNGRILIDPEEVKIENGDVEIINPKLDFWVCEETNIVGEYKHLKQEFVTFHDAWGNIRIQDGKIVKVRNDILSDLVWRPIWFTRHTTGVAPSKILGLQTTTPKIMGSRNIKKLVILFPDGRIGID